MALTLTGFGSAVPEQYATAQEALFVAQHVMRAPRSQHRKIAALYRGSRVAKRHCCFLKPRDQWREGPEFDLLSAPKFDGDRGPTTAERAKVFEDQAFPLALLASRRALAASGIDPRDITHLVTVTCTGFYAPGIDIKLMSALDLPATTQRAQIGFMGCQGTINGLRTANGFAHADPNARILLCSVELCTLHYHYGHELKNSMANALFADGAAAAVGHSSGGNDRSGRSGASGRNDGNDGGSDGGSTDDGDAIVSSSGWTIASTSSYLVPDSQDAMSWHIRDHGFIMGLSPVVPRLVKANLAEWITPWLAQNDLRIDDIESWAVHPGGPSILSAAGQALVLPEDALDVSWDVLKNFGNMSSATILFILERLRQAKAPMPCVVMAFGPGLMCEAVLLR